MSLIVKILGLVFACAGLLCLLKPLLINKLLDFFKKGNRIYLIALIRFALAVVFLVAARDCRVPWLIIVFGVLLLISGLLILILGAVKVSAIINWFQKGSTLLMRAIGLVIIVIGAVLLYAA